MKMELGFSREKKETYKYISQHKKKEHRQLLAIVNSNEEENIVTCL